MQPYTPPYFSGLFDILASGPAWRFGAVTSYFVARQGKGFSVRADHSDCDNAAIESSEHHTCADVLALAAVLGEAFYADNWQQQERGN